MKRVNCSFNRTRTSLINALSVVKKGEGITVTRREEYKYQDLAYEFAKKKAEVF